MIPLRVAVPLCLFLASPPLTAQSTVTATMSSVDTLYRGGPPLSSPHVSFSAPGGDAAPTETSVSTIAAGPIAQPVYTFARYSLPRDRPVDNGYCDASLVVRLSVGFVTGALVGLVSYSMLASIASEPSAKKRVRQLAAPLILGGATLGAIREAQYPSRLSCP